MKLLDISISDENESKTDEEVKNDTKSTVVNNGGTNKEEIELVFNSRKNKSFNASNYKVLYDELMNNSKGREIFQKYLKTEACSEEPILFLNAIDVLRASFLKNRNANEFSIKLWKKYFEELKKIVEMFIREESKTELNLQESQQKLLRSFDQEIEPHYQSIISQFGNKKISSPPSPSSPRSTTSSLKSSKSTDSSVQTIESPESLLFFQSLNPYVIFNDIIISVHVDLKMDQFPRFSRSKFLLDFLNKQGETFTRSIAIDVSRGFNVDIRFLPNDLSKNFIYDKDIYFGLGLVEDSPDWECIPCSEMSNQAQLFHSKTSYVFGNNPGMKLYKMVTILPYKLEDVYSVFCHLEGDEVSQNLTENRTLAFNAPHQAVSTNGVDEKTNPLAVQYVTSALKLLLPVFKEREYPRSLTCVYDSGLDAYINVGHTTTYSFYNVSSERVLLDMFLVNIMYRVKGDSTRFVYVIYLDAHTPKLIDSMFAKVHWKKRCTNIEKSFLQLLQNPSQSLLDKFQLKELAKENQKAYPNRSWYREYLNMFHKQ